VDCKPDRVGERAHRFKVGEQEITDGIHGGKLAPVFDTILLPA
jgi:hypothetical protein